MKFPISTRTSFGFRIFPTLFLMARAQNLIQNGGFEASTTSMAPWTVSSDNFNLGPSAFPQEGSNDISIYGNATLSQRTQASKGTKYEISFWAFVVDTQPQTMLATFGSAQWTFEVPPGGESSGPWNEFSSHTMAIGNDVLSFTAPGSSLMRIDNVSIAPDGATSASAPPSTPPPKKSDATPAIVGGVLGGLALLALVLIGVVIIVRRAGRSNTKMDEKMAALTQANNTTMRSETASVPMSTTGQSEKHSHQRTVTGSSSAVYPNSPFGTGHVASRSFQNSVSPPYPPNTVSPHNNTSSAMSNASQRRNNYSRSDDVSTQYQFSPPPPSQFSTPASVPDVYPSPDPRPDSTGTQVSWQSNSNNYSNSSYFVDPNAPPLPVNQGGSQSRVELYRPQGVRVEEENLERPDRYSIYRKKR